MDDGTEIIACLLWMKSNNKFVKQDDIDKMEKLCTLGRLVRVCGKLTKYREFMQVTIHNMVSIDYGEECLFWLQVMELTKTFYTAQLEPDAQNAQNIGDDDLKLYDALQAEPKYAEKPFVLQDIFEDENFLEKIPSFRSLDSASDRLGQIRSAMDRLASKGQVVSRFHPDRFELIRAKDLIPFISRFIHTQITENPSNNVGGVHLMFITKHIRSMPFFSRVQDKLVKQAIQYMLESSEFIESAHERFTPLK